MKKHVLITGGSDGLGKIVAQKLITSGLAVTILSIDRAAVRAVAAAIGAQGVVADVSDWRQVAQAVAQAEAYQPIDVLINNAGVWTPGQLEDNDPAVIKRVMDVNALGTILVTRAVLPAMKTRGHGRIINVISQDGLKSKPQRSVYTASKWAVTGFTKCLQDDFAGTRLTATGVYPGLMRTKLFEKNGVFDRDMSDAIDPHLVADEIVHVATQPDDIEIPEVGMQSSRYV